jgi:5-methyltetrahydrofolate--homocysteine methyltransferase
METVLRSIDTTVVIRPEKPTVLIGEKISAAARNDLAEDLRAGSWELVRSEAKAQVAAGADVLEVNVGAPGVDEVTMLPEAVRVVLEAVDVPVSIDTADFEALEAALATHQELAPDGKPLINSVNGEERYLKHILPLAAKYNAAVIGMALDDDGIPETPEGRLAVARKIVERAEAAGVPPEDVLIDVMALSVSTDPKAGRVTLEAITLVRDELGVNMTLGPSNVSFGLPERPRMNGVFLAMAIQNGVNCPIINVARERPFVLTADLLAGRDRDAMRYIEAYRERSDEE